MNGSPDAAAAPAPVPVVADRQWDCLAADFARYLELYPGHPRHSWLKKVKIATTEEAFWVVFWYRFGRWALVECRIPGVAFACRALAKVMSRLHRIVFGISIAPACAAGPGLYFGHHGGVWINPRVRLGRQVSIMNGVTIGEGGTGATHGVPTIGDFVYIGPHATIVSRIRVGSGCVIGANSLVVTDVPDGATAIGVPARVMVQNGNALAARADAARREAAPGS
jgi:serine O-acetyltransferase